MAQASLRLLRAAHDFAEGHTCSGKENADPSPLKGIRDDS
jgi:hypothetical protein